MKNVKEESKLLASLTVFRELYDKQKDVYGVIAEFLKEVIVKNGKRKFNTTEITNLLNNSFDFSLPEAVVNTAIKRLNLPKEDGVYIVQTMPVLENRTVETLQEQNLNSNVELFSNLFSFIEAKKGINLSENEKTNVVRSFCSFLLDDTNPIDYSEYISGFAIANKNDENFRKNINKIREGVILYSGIKYSNLGEMGSWQTNITIYLDTEILFYFAGYGGKLYKSLFEDFYNYVKEINNKAGRVLVKLEYFEEVRIEIDEFFNKAEDIVKGKDRLNPKGTAMAYVVDGCQTPSDVLSKKSDFYRSLKINGILESEKTNYYAKENHDFNIVDAQTIQNISNEFGADITENIKFLNYVNIQRKKEFLNSFENIGHILLTGTSLTLKIASHEKINPERTVPLATSLYWVTNRFWFKLNKGFGDGNFPSSFDVISKAQMVLSAILNKSIGEKYDELQTEFRQGKITEEIAKSRVVQLRSQAMKPEDIGREDVLPILDALSENSLEEFVKEQEFSRNEAMKQSLENVKLKKELSLTEEALAIQETARINTQNELIRSKEKSLIDKTETIEKLENSKRPIDKLVYKDINNFKMKIGVAAAFLFAIPIFLTWEFGIDVMSVISWLSPFLLLLYLLVFEKEWKWKPTLFLEKKKEQFQMKRYLEFNFDINHLNKLREESKSLENEIYKLKAEYPSSKDAT